jgi:hypothetical protein
MLSPPLTIYLLRRIDQKALKLPASKVFKKAVSAANRPVTVLILWDPDPQALSIDHPRIVINVPRTII